MRPLKRRLDTHDGMSPSTSQVLTVVRSLRSTSPLRKRTAKALHYIEKVRFAATECTSANDHTSTHIKKTLQKLEATVVSMQRMGESYSNLVQGLAELVPSGNERGLTTQLDLDCPDKVIVETPNSKQDPKDHTVNTRALTYSDALATVSAKNGLPSASRRGGKERDAVTGVLNDTAEYSAYLSTMYVVYFMEDSESSESDGFDEFVASVETASVQVRSLLNGLAFDVADGQGPDICAGDSTDEPLQSIAQNNVKCPVCSATFDVSKGNVRKACLQHVLNHILVKESNAPLVPSASIYNFVFTIGSTLNTCIKCKRVFKSQSERQAHVAEHVDNALMSGDENEIIRCIIDRLRSNCEIPEPFLNSTTLLETLVKLSLSPIRRQEDRASGTSDMHSVIQDIASYAKTKGGRAIEATLSTHTRLIGHYLRPILSWATVCAQDAMELQRDIRGAQPLSSDIAMPTEEEMSRNAAMIAALVIARFKAIITPSGYPYASLMSLRSEKPSALEKYRWCSTHVLTYIVAQRVEPPTAEWLFDASECVNAMVDYIRFRTNYGPKKAQSLHLSAEINCGQRIAQVRNELTMSADEASLYSAGSVDSHVKIFFDLMKVQGVFANTMPPNRYPTEVTAAMSTLKDQRTARASFIKPFTPVDMRYYIMNTVLNKSMNMRAMRDVTTVVLYSATGARTHSILGEAKEVTPMAGLRFQDVSFKYEGDGSLSATVVFRIHKGQRGATSRPESLPIMATGEIDCTVCWLLFYLDMCGVFEQRLADTLREPSWKRRFRVKDECKALYLFPDYDDDNTLRFDKKMVVSQLRSLLQQLEVFFGVVGSLTPRSFRIGYAMHMGYKAMASVQRWMRDDELLDYIMAHGQWESAQALLCYLSYDDRQFHRVKRLYYQALDRYRTMGRQGPFPSPYSFHICLFQRAECDLDEEAVHRLACHIFAETEPIALRDYAAGDVSEETHTRGRRDVSSWRIKLIKRVARVLLSDRLSCSPSNGVKIKLDSIYWDLDRIAAQPVRQERTFYYSHDEGSLRDYVTST